MKIIAWRPNLTLPADPNDSEIYRWDWADWLDGETLVNPPVIIADPGITAALYYLGTDYADVRITGGAAGVTYAVTVRATSATRSRVADRSVRFAVGDL